MTASVSRTSDSPPVSDFAWPVLVAGLGTASAAAVTLAALDGPTMCPFRLCTGAACPGCGLTRSALTLLQGEVATSVRFHPLLIVFVAQALIALALGRTLRTRLLPVAIAANGVLFVAVWLVRWRLGLLDFVLDA